MFKFISSLVTKFQVWNLERRKTLIGQAFAAGEDYAKKQLRKSPSTATVTRLEAEAATSEVYHESEQGTAFDHGILSVLSKPPESRF